MRVVRQLLRLAAAEVGVEHQPLLIEMLQQHDALIRLAVFVDGRDAHGGGIGQARVAGLFQPTLEQFERVGGQIVAAQAASGVFTAQVRNIKLTLFNHLGYRPTEKIRRYILRLRHQELNRSDAAVDLHSVNTQSLMTTLPLRSR